ncbi:hypothetical protein CEXT_571251 [Caerostris extrusa]|uniref:Uncharacterized protein n=1 Tax=Caerostris extrusa TaxID=172846 RepID=A0AAV4NEM1_CAEEX|nr:hypothetical protein CEXT_571251 [Caerostris extrusa]
MVTIKSERIHIDPSKLSCESAFNTLPSTLSHTIIFLCCMLSTLCQDLNPTGQVFLVFNPRTVNTPRAQTYVDGTQASLIYLGEQINEGKRESVD